MYHINLTKQDVVSLSLCRMSNDTCFSGKSNYSYQCNSIVFK